MFSELFAQLGSHRDRALVAFWVSTGARASELLGVAAGDADPGQQLITVVRKGSRALQQLPAAPDAFVWLRLYQAQLAGLVPAGRDQPLWWTLTRPHRPLSYHAARAMFVRAGAALGANWSIHDLRHTAAYRMARDPGMPLTASVRSGSRSIRLAALCRRSCRVQFAPSSWLTPVNTILAAS
jgi:integrase